MKLATIRVNGSTAAAVERGDTYVELPFRDVGALLWQPDWRAIAQGADGPSHARESVQLAPVVPRPEKIICMGLNYATHVEETDNPELEHPTLFAKFARTLTGPYDDVRLPADSQAVDYEAELVAVIGTEVRSASPEEAEAAICGYTVLNDVSMRDFQNRTTQWLQGKMWEATTPIGPALVTKDEAGPVANMRIQCEVNGEVLQDASCADLIFDPVRIVQYISTIITLVPGDLVSTGTPGGVGMARDPARLLKSGDVVRTSVSSVGECLNKIL